jgi:Rieske Fe-S protein
MGKLCEHDGCTKQPSFNNPGERAGRFCASHKLGGMVDVLSKVCEHDGCTKQPKFNTPGKKGGLYCAAHKSEGMVNVKKRKLGG